MPQNLLRFRRFAGATASLVTLALLAACSDVSPPTELPTPPPAPSAGLLPGQPTAKAMTVVPDSTFRPRSQDYTIGHPDLPGMRVSFNTVLVGIRPDATVAGINTLMQRLGAAIVGGIAGKDGGPGALMVLRLPTTTHAAMAQALTTLRAAPEVLIATADMVTSVQAVTPVGTSEVSWNWTSGAYAGDPNLGTWGLAAIRAPQMWNLNPQLRADGRTVATGVLDIGFDPANEDLRNVSTMVGRQRAENHGTHVASIIGAEHGNGVGIDGTNPFARLFLGTLPIPDADATFSDGSITLGLIVLLRAQPAIRVVNVSLGYKWTAASRPSTNIPSREQAADAGTVADLALQILEFTQPLPVIVSAAGNNGGEQAIFGSGLNNAGLKGLNGNAAIIVVEADSAVDGATAATYARAGFSDIVGHLSAPGLRIPGARIGASTYANDNGTSFAAPYVTGVVGYMMALKPNLPAPTKERNVIREILLRTTSRAPSRNGQRQVDGFAAALELDTFFGTDGVLVNLLDIDDGTADGNTRIDPFTRAPVLTSNVRADSTIDMSDFRRWRDLMSAVVFENSATFDGAVDHPKRDVNGDSLFGTVAQENMFPFADFNGDGQLSLSAVAPMAGVLRPRGALTDLQVLQSRFSDSTYSAADLDLLTASGDVHLSPEACSVSAGQSVRIRVTQVGGSFVREHRFRAGEARFIVTVPVVVPTGSAYVVQVARLDPAGVPVSLRDTTVRIALAQDIAVRPECESVATPVIQGHFRGIRTILTGGRVGPVCATIVKIIGPTLNRFTTLGDSDFILIFPPNDFDPQLYLPRFELAGGRINLAPGNRPWFRFRDGAFSAPDPVFNTTTVARDSTIIQVEAVFSTSGSFDGNRLSLTLLHSVFHTSPKMPRTLKFDEDQRYDLVRTTGCP